MMAFNRRDLFPARYGHICYVQVRACGGTRQEKFCPEWVVWSGRVSFFSRALPTRTQMAGPGHAVSWCKTCSRQVFLEKGEKPFSSSAVQNYTGNCSSNSKGLEFLQYWLKYKACFMQLKISSFIGSGWSFLLCIYYFFHSKKYSIHLFVFRCDLLREIHS
jgi:hypothetical protein